MQLDYWLLVRKSMSNAWNLKFLWLFGFLAVASDGASGVFNINLPEKKFFPFDFNPFLVLWIALIAVFLGFVFFLLGTLSEGSLIHGIRERNAGRSVTFGQCWTAGVEKFWRLLVILILLGLLILFAIIVMAMVVVPGFIASTALGLLLVLLLLPLIIAVVIVIEAVSAWAIRFGVIDDSSWDKSLQNGWKMFTTNLGRSFGVAISSVLTQIFATVIFILAMLILAIPFVLIGFVNVSGAVAMGVLIGVPLIVSFSAAMGVFQSSIWTLAFLEITGRQEDLPQMPAINPDAAI